ncbi:hypothetical protein LP52_05465 [Streptomonospora alba]|uniref:Uncharacterized protein n=1 Tax=Streptomonospora alba TaxID=183763 RepID=A0A0C2G8J1_9ACTN|nr:hypothetical protein LP52_05465 [Streptomonospora alba]
MRNQNEIDQGVRAGRSASESGTYRSKRRREDVAQVVSELLLIALRRVIGGGEASRALDRHRDGR